MADIFISYKREDGAVCAAFADALVANGYTVWFDRDIREGDSWDRTIEREIGSASAVLVLWSRRSRESDWVRNEARFAKQASRLLPVRIEQCELPLEFAAIQTVDAFDLPGFFATPGWSRLLDRIDAMVGRERPGAVATAEPMAATPLPAPTATSHPSSSRPLLILIAVLLAIIAVGLLGMTAYLRRGPSHGAAEPAPAAPVADGTSITAAPPAADQTPASPAPPVNQADPLPTSEPTTRSSAAPVASPTAASPAPVPAAASGCDAAANALLASATQHTMFSLTMSQPTAPAGGNPEAARRATELADYFTQNAIRTVWVVGERRRRQLVRRALVAHGIPEGRIQQAAPLCNRGQPQPETEVRVYMVG